MALTHSLMTTVPTAATPPRRRHCPQPLWQYPQHYHINRSSLQSLQRSKKCSNVISSTKSIQTTYTMSSLTFSARSYLLLSQSWKTTGQSPLNRMTQALPRPLPRPFQLRMIGCRTTATGRNSGRRQTCTFLSNHPE